MSDPDFPQVPDFKDLPKVEGMPHGCAWGVFDKSNQKDRLGALNYLTPSTVRAAYAELRTGTSVSLNAPLDALSLGFGRRNLAHTHINWKALTAGTMNAWDDELHFNTQASSQWDSLLHYAHQPSGRFYNGATPDEARLGRSSDDAAGADADPDADRDSGDTGVPSLEHWHTRGGLVGRGVLLDYRGWVAAKGMEYGVNSRHVITVAALEEVAAWQGTELRAGDILLVRTGWVEEMLALGSEEKRRAAMAGSQGQMVGVEGTKRSAEWFWTRRFAAVAADNIAFEVLSPEKEDGTIGTPNDLVLHPYFLSFFGLHIGEMWALKDLAEQCAKLKRYSFLLTSVPLNVPGLVGSPPNALALF